MAEGRDLAVYQGDEPEAWFAQFDFAIIQAFDEVGIDNPDFEAQYAAAKAANMRFGVGVYGWAIHGADNAALGARLRSMAPDAASWWDDHEIGGRSAMPTPAEVLAFLAGVGDPRSGYYSNLSDYLGISAPWWAANPSNDRVPRVPVLTQYGVVDGVDADRADDAVLAAFLGQTPGPARKKGSDMECIATVDDNAQNEKLWLYDPSTQEIAVQIPLGEYELHAGSGIATTQNPVNELLLVGAINTALTLQNRPPL